MIVVGRVTKEKTLRELCAGFLVWVKACSGRMLSPAYPRFRIPHLFLLVRRKDKIPSFGTNARRNAAGCNWAKACSGRMVSPKGTGTRM
jgi:hypothetical protein